MQNVGSMPSGLGSATVAHRAIAGGRGAKGSAETRNVQYSDIVPHRQSHNTLQIHPPCSNCASVPHCALLYSVGPCHVDANIVNIFLFFQSEMFFGLKSRGTVGLQQWQVGRTHSYRLSHSPHSHCAPRWRGHAPVSHTRTSQQLCGNRR